MTRFELRTSGNWATITDPRSLCLLPGIRLQESRGLKLANLNLTIRPLFRYSFYRQSSWWRRRLDCRNSITTTPNSVTRFGEILLLWQIFQSLWQIFNVNLVFSKIVKLLWQILYEIGQIFIVIPRLPIIELTIYPSGHTDAERLEIIFVQFFTNFSEISTSGNQRIRKKT